MKTLILFNRIFLTHPFYCPMLIALIVFSFLDIQNLTSYIRTPANIIHAMVEVSWFWALLYGSLVGHFVKHLFTRSPFFHIPQNKINLKNITLISCFPFIIYLSIISLQIQSADLFFINKTLLIFIVCLFGFMITLNVEKHVNLFIICSFTIIYLFIRDGLISNRIDSSVNVSGYSSDVTTNFLVLTTLVLFIIIFNSFYKMINIHELTKKTITQTSYKPKVIVFQNLPFQSQNNRFFILSHNNKPYSIVFTVIFVFLFGYIIHNHLKWVCSSIQYPIHNSIEPDSPLKTWPYLVFFIYFSFQIICTSNILLRFKFPCLKYRSIKFKTIFFSHLFDCLLWFIYLFMFIFLSWLGHFSYHSYINNYFLINSLIRQSKLILLFDYKPIDFEYLLLILLIYPWFLILHFLTQKRPYIKYWILFSVLIYLDVQLLYKYLYSFDFINSHTIVLTFFGWGIFYCVLKKIVRKENS